jgi:hypothetical protein
MLDRLTGENIRIEKNRRFPPALGFANYPGSDFETFI